MEEHTNMNTKTFINEAWEIIILKRTQTNRTLVRTIGTRQISSPELVGKHPLEELFIRNGPRENR